MKFGKFMVWSLLKVSSVLLLLLVMIARSGHSGGDGGGHRRPVRADPPRHLLQRFELLLVHQRELGDEVEEVFVAGVHVRLGADRHQTVKVMHVNVDKHAVEAGQNLLANALEKNKHIVRAQTLVRAC